MKSSKTARASSEWSGRHGVPVPERALAATFSGPVGVSSGGFPGEASMASSCALTPPLTDTRQVRRSAVFWFPPGPTCSAFVTVAATLLRLPQVTGNVLDGGWICTVTELHPALKPRDGVPVLVSPFMSFV